jgi:hypothetical protein
MGQRKGQVLASVLYPPSESKSPVVHPVEDENAVPKVSASAPDGEMCFLLIGSEMTPEQTQRCAD